MSGLSVSHAQQPRLGGPTAVASDPTPPATLLPDAAVTKVSATLDRTVDARDRGDTAKAKAKEGKAPAAEAAAKEPESAWFTNQHYRNVPRTGNFYMPPKGCGYGSLLDLINGESRTGPVPGSAYPSFALMPPSLFDADFRYVDKKGYESDFLDSLHRIHLGDNWLLATGGQANWRHMHEFNSRLSGKNNDYDLFRVRPYADLWYKDVFRIYAEMIFAGTANQDLPPLRIDENSVDFQNLFFDVKIGEVNCNNVYLRVGRQEIMLGSQRMISALDWANTRRTFEGARAFWSSEKFDFDAFWLKPVLANNSKSNGYSCLGPCPEGAKFDSDPKQNFYGAWATYRPATTAEGKVHKGTAIDLYWLFLDNSNKAAPLTIPAAIFLKLLKANAPTSVHTLGTRYAGDKDNFLWDFESMLQLGQRGDSNIVAGAATAGVGYNAKHLPMNPTVWAYYDWASGDHSPNAGNYNTFNQLFPFGHYYYGMIDLIGRQNIRDWNFHLYLNPVKWVTINAQYHFLALDSSRDALYGPSGAPTRVRLNGSAGGVVGQEYTILANFHVTPRSDFLVGYAKMNSGNFVSNTGNSRSPELFYLMYNVRW
ncbi:MAG: alginate export family protein [Gemmataceae bacterium]|nr:alginate export family protein [Gemmataceae bacterium]